jgi:hypothetical protein
MRQDPEALGLWKDITEALKDAGLQVVAHTAWEVAQGISVTPAGGEDRGY